MGDRGCLARARTGEDDDRPGYGFCDGALIVIQLADVLGRITHGGTLA